ncbi:GNAT family N-acetyltransferase [Sporolactobacillus shoreae]|uniref:GNAT family N-acetyltransferase n=1 Tax=Sporolactobacillus shoreae TaxID=1465501 RepID=UPI0030C875AC
MRKAMEEREQAIIAFHETLPVGMVRFILRSDAVYFYRLSVIPEKQGHGIAKIILNNLEEFARENGKNKAVCRVRKNVERNIKLYQSIGFHIFDHETVHKSGGINIEVVSMQKKLK